MFSSGSEDKYLVSKKPQNRKQKNDHTTAQKAVGVPIADSCFKSSKKTSLFFSGVQRIQAQGSPRMLSRDESLAPKSHKGES